ncbi:hypothetical protein Bxe_A0558 [Paraburkholderia xenovorans LB400]|uniref:Uncharacterized protein n=1 Tax=Paraburkholderia xenovorans (strain LB400) TaxID=266265 RepID=Q13U64_PARXL|nr:hypothetical protein Bxe_A0558 [Paraburkholderia xenovorans LB400]
MARERPRHAKKSAPATGTPQGEQGIPHPKKRQVRQKIPSPKRSRAANPLQQRIPMSADAHEAATIRSPSACRHLDSRCRANFSLTRINILSKVVKVPPVVLSRLIGSLGPLGER